MTDKVKHARAVLGWSFWAGLDRVVLVAVHAYFLRELQLSITRHGTEGLRGIKVKHSVFVFFHSES